jgi:hypothetical protein
MAKPTSESMEGRFHWGLDGLNQQKFRAYTTLLRLRCGGQEDPNWATELLLDEEAETRDEGGDDADTAIVQKISDFDEPKLKKALLDRLAELTSNIRKGSHVAASLLLETQDSCTVFVAKNNGFSGTDKKFLEDLESSLRDISCTESKCPSQSHETREVILAGFEPIDAKLNLWDRMTDHYQSRLQEWAGDLRRALKEYNNGAISNETYATPRLQHLKQLLDRLSREEPGLTDEDHRRSLVDKCYDIHSSYEKKDFARLCPAKPSHELWLSICFMGRLRIAYKVMVRAAERLSGFESLNICPVELSQAYKNRKILSSDCWSLAKAFESLGEDFSDFNAKQLFKKSKSTLIQKFSEEQKRPLQFHAEVQLILHITQSNCPIDSVFKYIGCSKYSCPLCYMFVSRCGKFGTRGCHGKVSSPWTIPEANGLSQEHLHQITQSLKFMQKELEKRIYDRERKPIPHKTESTVGGSSLATKRSFANDANNPQLGRIISDHLHRQRM